MLSDTSIFNHRAFYWFVCVRVKLLQSCLTLCDPMDCNPPDSSVHGIFWARILERVIYWLAVRYSLVR